MAYNLRSRDRKAVPVVKDIEDTTKFRRNTSVFLILAVVAFSAVAVFFINAPKATAPACDSISMQFIISGVIPKFLGGRDDKLGTVRRVWQCATQYKAVYPNYALGSFCIVYITLQTFAIPGPIIFSILSGALYPFVFAQLLVAFCATTGASLCFLLSYLLGKGALHRLFPTMLDQFTAKIAENRQNLFYYLLFLRITPLLPNWFVNIACPMVNVEFKYFFFATLFGLVPANFLHVSTGATLNDAAQNADSASSNLANFAILFCLQFIALLPTLFKSQIQQYDRRSSKKE